MNITDYTPVSTCQIAGLERIYESVFGLKENGSFVEIGAFDGKTYSNTYQLAKLGWSGLYVEPVQHLYEACILNHTDSPNVRVEKAFVADKDDEVAEIWKWGQDTYTGNKDFIYYVTDNQARLFATSTTKTLNTLLSSYDVHPQFDLLVIDVEGHELQVLQGLDLNVWRPRLIIVEAHALSTKFGLYMHAEEIDIILVRNGYRLIYVDAINSIYCEECSENVSIVNPKFPIGS